VGLEDRRSEPPAFLEVFSILQCSYRCCRTMRMSHEGERATADRIQDQPDRAPPHWLNPLVGRIHMIPEPRIEPNTPMSNQPPKTTATAPASNADQSTGVSRLPVLSRASTRATPMMAHKIGQTSNTSIHSNGVEDHPSLVSLFRYHASMPANVAAEQTSKPTETAVGLVSVGLSVCISANGEYQRWEPAATDAEIVTDPNGWLASAECSGWAVSFCKV
jgi:hypothetical protein